MVSEARKYRIRLILSLINNWDSYGGKAQYVKWAGDDAAADGGRLNITASVDDDFFSDQTVKVYFKNHVKVAVLFYILVIISSITTTDNLPTRCVCVHTLEHADEGEHVHQCDVQGRPDHLRVGAHE